MFSFLRICESSQPVPILLPLSATDLVTLVFYVTVEWLRRGYTFIAKDTKITLLDAEGICQFQLYMSYVSRFLSSWIIVAFTMERYIGVCYPLHRRHFCSKRGTRKCLVSITVLSLLLSIYKPMLSGVYVSDSGEHYCTTDSRFDFLSFILDNVFVVVIAVVPFLIITILNSKIIISLILRNKRNIRRKYVFEKSKIKIEFTFTLFAISFCFIAFNLPFFCVWSRNFFHSNYISNQDDIVSDLDVDYWQGVLYITRTLFYINYCINTFLYSLTGTYFRQEVKLLFTKQKRLRDCRSSSTMAVPLSMPTSTSQTWV